MKYNLELSGKRIRAERESMKCIVSRDETDREIITLVANENTAATAMTQANLLTYMRQLGLDTVGRNKLSALENGDETAFYSMTLSQWKDLADTFGTSVEWITGAEPYKTPTIKALCDVTGLSVSAAELMEEWNSKGFSALIECLSGLITNKDFRKCLNDMMRLQELYTAKNGDFDNYMDIHLRNQISMDLQGIPYTQDTIVRDLDKDIKTEKYNLNLNLTNMIVSIAESCIK